jgi:hypothetical protein
LLLTQRYAVSVAALNKLARRIVDQAISDEPPADDGKNPAAVALGS